MKLLVTPEWKWSKPIQKRSSKHFGTKILEKNLTAKTAVESFEQTDFHHNESGFETVTVCIEWHFYIVLEEAFGEKSYCFCSTNRDCLKYQTNFFHKPKRKNKFDHVYLDRKAFLDSVIHIRVSKLVFVVRNQPRHIKFIARRVCRMKKTNDLLLLSEQWICTSRTMHFLFWRRFERPRQKLFVDTSRKERDL